VDARVVRGGKIKELSIPDVSESSL
jgi:hypothetical protein